MWVEQLQQMEFKNGSSDEEPMIINIIFDHIEPTNKFFVDIGAGYYGRGKWTMSNTISLIGKGWIGVRVDANNNDDDSIIKTYVTPDNILGLMADWDVPPCFDLLSIDIDSFDLDILEKIVPVYKPRVICTEYNGTLNPESCMKLKYEPWYIWDETNKYGYSFGAGVKFCNKYGYKIILNHVNQNLFLVRGDLIGNVPPVSAKQTDYHPINYNAEWEEYI